MNGIKLMIKLLVVL